MPTFFGSGGASLFGIVQHGGIMDINRWSDALANDEIIFKGSDDEFIKVTLEHAGKVLQPTAGLIKADAIKGNVLHIAFYNPVRSKDANHRWHRLRVRGEKGPAPADASFQISTQSLPNNRCRLSLLNERGDREAIQLCAGALITALHTDGWIAEVDPPTATHLELKRIITETAEKRLPETTPEQFCKWLHRWIERFNRLLNTWSLSHNLDFFKLLPPKYIDLIQKKAPPYTLKVPRLLIDKKDNTATVYDLALLIQIETIGDGIIVTIECIAGQGLTLETFYNAMDELHATPPAVAPVVPLVQSAGPGARSKNQPGTEIYQSNQWLIKQYLDIHNGKKKLPFFADEWLRMRAEEGKGLLVNVGDSMRNVISKERKRREHEQ